MRFTDMSLRDANNLAAETILRADLCIVGAGAAGITIARALRGSGLTVLLLESGGLEPDPDVQGLYQGTVAGVDGLSLMESRVRAFGGTTRVWSGWCRPLEAEDFEERDWIPRSGWPPSLQAHDLEPYYETAHETTEIRAPTYDEVELADSVGAELLSFYPTRVRTFIFQFSPPTRFGERYRQDLATARDLEAYIHANLIEILLSDQGDAVTRFKFATLSGRRFSVSASCYVMAMGSIENARILLASNHQVESGVGNRHDRVGRTFMEHPHFIGGGYAVLSAEPHDLYLSRARAPIVADGIPSGEAATVGAVLGLPRVVRSRERLIGVTVALRRGKPEELFEGYGDQFSTPSPSDVAALVAEGASTFCRIDVRSEQRPLLESRVTLTDVRDAIGIPRAQLDWRIAESDFADVLHTLRLIAAELGRTGIGRVWIPVTEHGRYSPQAISGGCHHMGTTRMSEAPGDGVVDADCRVHGIDNLYVAGSSVFPTGGFANPTLTIVALSHRLAEHLRTVTPKYAASLSSPIQKPRR